jgi:DNA-binding NarL/FixJ family response regulator
MPVYISRICIVLSLYPEIKMNMDSKKNVLLVEDAKMIQDRLKCMLEKSPKLGTLYIAGNYEEAREVLSHQWIDLAILDINLPGRSGIEVLRYIKKEFGHVHAIMLTNEWAGVYRRMCLELGAEQFFDKSSDFNKIAQFLEEL